MKASLPQNDYAAKNDTELLISCLHLPIPGIAVVIPGLSLLM